MELIKFQLCVIFIQKSHLKKLFLFVKKKIIYLWKDAIGKGLLTGKYKNLENFDDSIPI